MVLRDVHGARKLRGFYAHYHNIFKGEPEGHNY
jgi:hypothetical protein